MTIFEPLDRVSVSKNVIAQIQAAMKQGRLCRGDQLPPEPELADQLQVSRSSLREALKVLEIMGVLEVRRGNGTFITEKPRLPAVDPLLFLLLLEDGTTSDLIEVRYMIEVGFTQLAQTKLKPEHVEQLEKSIVKLRKAVEAGHPCAEHDLEFHRIILEVTDNPFVIQVGNTILELFRDSISRGVQNFPTHAVEHHEAILEALKSSEPMRVEEVITRSYEVWKTLVVSS